jgi:hypothetical protein
LYVQDAAPGGGHPPVGRSLSDLILKKIVIHLVGGKDLILRAWTLDFSRHGRS